MNKGASLASAILKAPCAALFGGGKILANASVDGVANLAALRMVIAFAIEFAIDNGAYPEQGLYMANP